jgi:hydrogenase maturation protein HypF
VARGPRLGPIGDGTLWGGEALLGAPGHWQRVASFRPFHLPGGEKAGREPWRSALALCWETGSVWRDAPPDTALLFDAWQKRLNCPATSAVGRLFDAAAALTGINLSSSFEGQGPMMLEATTTTMADPVALPLAHDAHGLLRSDWAPLVPLLLDDARTIPERSARFHASLAQTLLAQAMHLRATQGEFVVGLSGGVFQNRILAELCLARLATHGFNAKLARCCPGNDGGISYGQIIEAAARFDLT